MAETRTFDPGQLSLIFGGRLFNSWKSVSITMDEDGWTFSTGTSGELTRVRNLSKLATIDVVVSQSSQDSDFMTAFQITGVLISVLVKDGSGTSLCLMPQGTVTKLADKNYNKEESESTWSIKGNAEINIVGGNV